MKRDDIDNLRREINTYDFLTALTLTSLTFKNKTWHNALLHFTAFYVKGGM